MGSIMSDKSYALEQGDFQTPATCRPVIYGTNGVISSGHYLTSMAGMQILLRGGNAFDALAASVFAAAVIEPTASYSLGAESTFMLFEASKGDLLVLSGQGPSPSSATPEWFASKGLTMIPTGPGLDAPMAFTVPGVVGATLSMLERFGTCSVEDILSPAVNYALDGFPHYEYMLSRLGSEEARQQFNNFPPGGMNIFFDQGKLPDPGSVLIQTALGNTLNKMVSAAQAFTLDRLKGIRAAHECFYSGEIAQSIISNVNTVGGLMTGSDLEGYQAQYSSPVSVSFNGLEVHTQSTWTQSPVCLQALNILKHFDLVELGHNSAQYIHLVTEALKLAFADREAFYGDPDCVAVPIDGLLSEDYAEERAKLIDTRRASPGLPDFGNPWQYSTLSGKTSDQPSYTSTKSADADDGYESGTTHISVIDQQGNMACATPSGGAFNKSVFFPDLGFALSTRSEMFNLVPGHPNCLAPGKRPRTTIVNMMVSRDGAPIMMIGCPGGDAQSQANLQLLLNVVLWGMNTQEAVEKPRFATMSVPNSFYPHTYLTGQLALEHELPGDVALALEKMGHKVIRTATCGMGATVTRKKNGGTVLETSSDPRRSCYALAW